MTSPAFTGAKVIAAILFERTMDGEAQGKPVPAFLWEDRGVVPFLKVDKGLEAEKDGVPLMKPMPGLDALLDRAVKLGVFGTKMRSVINLASKTGIAAIVAQQFEVAAQISAHGLMPIIEPEFRSRAPTRRRPRPFFATNSSADSTPCRGAQVMLKLTMPETADFYMPLIKHAGVRGRGAVRRLHARRCLPAPGEEPRHDRELLAGADEGLTRSMSDADSTPRWPLRSTRSSGLRARRFETHATRSSPPDRALGPRSNHRFVQLQPQQALALDLDVRVEVEHGVVGGGVHVAKKDLHDVAIVGGAGSRASEKPIACPPT